jgi:hypothetical protein
MRSFTLFAWCAFVVCGLLVATDALADVMPDAAPPGAVVTIAGKGLGEFKSAQYNRVLFHGVPALIQRWESDLIEVRVPHKATNGPVEVVRGKKKNVVGSFTVTKPVIQALTPVEVEAGAVIQISGSNFGPTAGSRDPNTMFGVNDVLISGASAKIRRWREDKIEVEVPPTAGSGEVVVRLASSDPLPDGSCCATVDYTVSNALPVTVLPTIRMDPVNGPVGTKVVLFGKNFGDTRGPGDAVLFNDRPATIAQWKDPVIVVHVPLDATTGPLVLKRGDTQRTIGIFTVRTPKAIGLSATAAPIGSLIRITGENFGFYSEAGSTPFNYIDFQTGDNGVEIGGVPAIVYRWHDDRIDVWVPASAKSGPVVVRRGATRPKDDGTCCAERAVVTVTAGEFTVVTPKVESYDPTSAGLDEIVTIKGKGFGTYIKTTEATQPDLGVTAFDMEMIRLGENISRSEVLFSGIAGVVVSWTDTEIQVRVPRRHAFGVGRPGEFATDLTTGPLVVRRGSWDLNADGTCCSPKRWVTAEAGQFTILAKKGLPDQGYWQDTTPGRD